MSDFPEPIHDIAHLGHIELLSPKPQESLCFFRDVLGRPGARRRLLAFTPMVHPLWS